jgi:hypothetical protein
MQILIHVCAVIPMNTHAHYILMDTSERLSRLDLEIYKVDHQERLIVNEDITSN